MNYFIFLFACQSPSPPLDPNGMLQPMFWTHFQGAIGCTGIHLSTWSPDGTVGMDIAIPGIPTDREVNAVFHIADRSAMVMVETGREIPVNFCVDEIAEIPVQQVYHSTTGTVELQIQQDGDEYYATAKLMDVTLQNERVDHAITLSTIQLPNVQLSAKRTQDPNRKRIQHDIGH